MYVWWYTYVHFECMFAKGLYCYAPLMLTFGRCLACFVPKDQTLELDYCALFPYIRSLLLTIIMAINEQQYYVT